MGRMCLLCAWLIYLFAVIPLGGAAWGQSEESRRLGERARELFAVGKIGEAIPLAERALNQYEKELPPHHPTVVAALITLAQLYEAQGRLNDAEDLYKRALSLRERTLAPDNLAIAESLTHLGALYRRLGRHAEADPLYSRAFAIEQKLPTISSGEEEARRQKAIEEVRRQAALEREKAEQAAQDAKRFAERLDAERFEAERRRRDDEDARRQAAPSRDRAAAEEARRQRDAEEAKYQAAMKQRATAEREVAEAKAAEEARRTALEARRLAEAKAAEEAKRAADFRQAAEARRIADAKALEATGADPRKAAEAKKAADAKAAEEHKLAGEAKKAAEARKMADAKAAEKAAQAAEARQLAEGKFANVPVYFGTNRKTGPQLKKEKLVLATFGSEPLDELVLGAAVVTVPTEGRDKGKIPLPRKTTVFGVTFSEKEDPSKHFTLRRVEILSDEQFLQEVRAQLKGSNVFKEQALLFVHGYYVTFENALHRTAQIAFDLEFDGASFLFNEAIFRGTARTWTVLTAPKSNCGNFST
jgi:hypothetical protein